MVSGWHSTETSIIGTTDTILREIDQKMLTSAVILDMSTAFDSINHETLILKLQDVGVDFQKSPLSDLIWRGTRIQLSSGFVATLMIDNKWYESIQHFQSPYPLTAAFRRETYSGQFYLASTPMILLQHQRNAAFGAM